MKLATLGFSVVAFASLASSDSAQAIDVRHNIQLGAPLYAGPNVVIVQDGYGRTLSDHGRTVSGYGRTVSGYGRTVSGYGLSGSVTIYGQPPPRRYGYGNGYGKGHGNRYGHRPPPRPYYYGRPAPRHHVYPRRERHPQPYLYGNPNHNPNHGPNYGYAPYGNPRHAAPGNPRHAAPGNPHRGPRLTILGATYRSIDGRACNAYSYAHRKCDGNQSCTVKASNSICGDPDRGRLKVLEVSYACGNRQFTSNTPERSRSQIRCR
ncbi:MAG: hypothetical protein RIC29_08105 [Rhodospirillaceae bacterium]